MGGNQRSGGNTRCLIAEPGGVGRDYPLSIEKLSPILAYYTVKGLDDGARLCDQILHYGGMGHTASIHTTDRNAALQYGALMPAARVVVNTPSTHGAIGFSTALAPSMTLGCGSWGGNVTSDNISPLHLMDIKRVAFEVRPVTSAGDVRQSQVLAEPLGATTPTHLPPQQPARPAVRTVDRAAIASLVDKFLSDRKPAIAAEPVQAPEAMNGRAGVDFVCEDDVRRAIQKGEKIFVNAKTIITPAARELGDTREVFAKGS